MIIHAIPPIEDFGIRTPSEPFVNDEDYLPGTEDWAVVESLRSPRDGAQERDAEDERFIALMLGGDAFD
ncbi:MAG TPA: hypothetical protein VGK44_15410 [Casimicrobiaceae bacterium]|jgi:hypothetical protein